VNKSAAVTLVCLGDGVRKRQLGDIGPCYMQCSYMQKFHGVKFFYIVGYFYTGPNPQVSDKV